MAAKKSAGVPKRSSSTKARSAVGKTPKISLWELKKEIDERAHQIYLDRIADHKPGDELSDWLQAENEIKKKHNLT